MLMGLFCSVLCGPTKIAKGNTYSTSRTDINLIYSPASVGASVGCVALVYGSSPTGTITWSSNSSTGSFSSTLTPLEPGGVFDGMPIPGRATTTFGDTTVGTVVITATYSGDSNNAPSSCSTDLIINPRPHSFS